MSNPHASNSDEIDLMDFIRPILSRWKLVLLVFILGGIVAFSISWTRPKIYRSEASLYVQQNSTASSLLRSLPVSLGASGGSSSNDYFLTLLQSQSMRTSVVDKMDLRHNKLLFPNDVPSMSETIEKISDIVSVSENKTGSVVISVTTVNPQLAANIANTMLDLLGKYVVTASKKKVSYTSERLDKTEKELNVAERSLMDFLEHNDVASIDDQTRQMIDRLGTSETDILSLEAEIKKVTSELQNSGDVDSLVELEVQKRSLEASRDFLQSKRDELRKSLSKLPAVAAKYSRIQRRIMVLSKTFEMLTEQYQMAQITQKGEDGDYQIIDRARPNPKKVGPHNALNAGLGALLSALATCFIINIRIPGSSNKADTKS